MIDNTINDDKTIAGVGEGAILAGRCSMLRHYGNSNGAGMMKKIILLAVMTSVAALTGVGAGQMPRNAQGASQRAIAAQTKKPTSGLGAEKRVPETGKDSSVAEVTSVSPTLELTFSKKLLGFPLPKVIQKKSKDDMDAVEFGQKRKNEIFYRAAPYVPDIFYEKSQLPFAEREKFLNSAEKQEIIKALREKYEPTLGRTKVWNISLMKHVLDLCDEMVIYGRPLASIRAETKSLREAVDLCGMIQLGKWMDTLKAKHREYQEISIEDYDEREGFRQTKYITGFIDMYGSMAYDKAVGLRPDKPISPDCPYYSAEDFAHLSASQKKELLDMFKLLPHTIRSVPGMTPEASITDYSVIKADTTGYGYVAKYAHIKLKKDKAIKLQKLCLEILTYTHPLALLKIKDYSLERTIYTCHFTYADEFYQRKQKNDDKKPKKLSEKEQVIYDREANALIDLGKKFKHPDWVQFGQEMYEEGHNAK